MFSRFAQARPSKPRTLSAPSTCCRVFTSRTTQKLLNWAVSSLKFSRGRRRGVQVAKERFRDERTSSGLTRSAFIARAARFSGSPRCPDAAVIHAEPSKRRKAALSAGESIAIRAGRGKHALQSPSARPSVDCFELSERLTDEDPVA